MGVLYLDCNRAVSRSGHQPIGAPGHQKRKTLPLINADDTDRKGFKVQFRRFSAIVALLAIARFPGMVFFPMIRCLLFLQRFFLFLQARFFHLRERYML
jgi:hypothetical protein